MKKKILAIFLAVVMIICMPSYKVTLTAAADDSHEHDGITFQNWESDTTLPSTEGSFVLTQDVTLNGVWNVPAGTVNLCLNGHVIRQTSASGHVVIIQTGAELNLYDCNTTSSHKGYIDTDGLWHLDEAGTHELQTGETEQSITGGVLTGGKSGGSNNGAYGGGVNVTSGVFNMYGGTIAGNQSSDVNGGGGVYVNFQTNHYGNYGNFTMYGGSICYNITTNNGANGGGVLLGSQGRFTMYGGNITNNRTAEMGGGIYTSEGPLSLTAAEGKEIIISGNYAGTNCGGVYTRVNTAISGKVIIKDNTCQDTNSPNNLGLRNYPANIVGALTGSEIHASYMNSSNQSVTGTLTSGFSTYNTGAKPDDFFAYDGPDSYRLILSSNGELKIVTPGTIYNYTPENDKDYNFGYITIDKSSAFPGETVEVTGIFPNTGCSLKSLECGDTSIEEDAFGKYCFIMPEGTAYVSAVFGHPGFYIGDGVHADDITSANTAVEGSFLAGDKVGASFDGWYTKRTGGELVSRDGINYEAPFTGFTADTDYYAHWSYKGAPVITEPIYVCDDAVYIGGEAVTNEVLERYNLEFDADTSTLTADDAHFIVSIDNDYEYIDVDTDGYYYGAAVQVEENATFDMKGNTTVSFSGVCAEVGNCWDISCYGGGVYVGNGGRFLMSDGQIFNNLAYVGAGVYVDNGGSFTMSGGEISQNKVVSLFGNCGAGGGVFLESGATFTMTGGSIKNNEADYVAGGVCVTNGATFTMSGGSITENGKGGIYYATPGESFTCLAAGTMITMADGSHRAIETLQMGDEVLAFDHETGEVTATKIYSFYEYPEKKTGAFTLHFTGDNDVTVVGGHLFFEKESCSYALIKAENAKDYIGHYFYNLDDDCWEQLEGISIVREPVRTFFIATEKQINCITDGMLSNEDGLFGKLCNIFEYDEDLKYNSTKMAADIEKYGLWDYSETEYTTEYSYESLNLKYIRVAIGKGLISLEELKEQGAYYKSRKESLGITRYGGAAANDNTADTAAATGSDGTDGEIVENLPAVRLFMANPSPATGVTLGGTAVVADNEDADLFLPEGMTINVGTGLNGCPAPADGMYVGVLLGTTDSIGQFTINGTQNDTKYFVPANDALYTKYDSGFLYLAAIPDEKPTVTIIQAEHGIIYSDKAFAEEDETVTLTNLPDEDYRITEYIVTKQTDGDEVTVAADGTFAMPEGGVVVTAVFEEIPKYTVSFELAGHGETISDMEDVVDGSSITLPTPVPTDSYIFTGWYKEEACTNQWDADTDIVTEDTVLYAKWRLHEHIWSYTASGNVITAECGDTEGTCGVTDLTLTITAENATYDGAAHGAEYTETSFIGFTADNFPAITYLKKDAEGNYTISVNGTPKAAGEYQAVIKVDSSTATTAFTISPKDITVTITSNGGPFSNYTGATAVFNGLVTGDTMVPVLKYYLDGEVTDPGDAGNYKVKASIPDTSVEEIAENYVLTGNVEADFIVTKDEITAPVIPGKVYIGSRLTADVDCTGKPYTVTKNEGGIEAGSYEVVLKLNNTVNCKWKDSDEASITLTFIITDDTYEYTISGYSDTEGNKVTADAEKAIKGTPVTLTVEAAEGYTFKALAVTDAEGNEITVNDNVFVMPAANVTIASEFTKDTPKPTPPAPGPVVYPQSKLTEDVVGETEAGNKADSGNEAESDAVNPGVAEKEEFGEDALVLELSDIESGDTEGGAAGSAAAVEAITEAVLSAVEDGNVADFVIKATEQTVTEQGIKNKAYADAADERITEVTKESESKSVTLAEEAIEAISEAEGIETLTIMTSVADIEFDEEAIDAINNQSDDDVTVVVTLLREEIAESEGEQSKVYFEISLFTSDGTEITDFDGGTVTVTLPIPKSMQGQDLVFVYSDGRGHYSPVEGKVNANGTYTYTTTHFSEYVLMTRSEAEKLYNFVYDFDTLKVNASDRTKDSITLKWSEYEDADGYIIYGNLCNSNGKTYKIKKLATITDSSVTEYTISGLKSDSHYKFRVKAYKMVNGEKYVTVKSYIIRSATLDKARATGYIELAQDGMKKTNTLALKNGAEYAISAKRRTDDKLIVRYASIKYESTDTSVATVSKDGVITAVGKGKCLVLVIAENGVYEEIEVTVK